MDKRNLIETDLHTQCITLSSSQLAGAFRSKASVRKEYMVSVRAY
ncbi:hypothetical protein CLV44_106144 [Marinobacterium halophilum]|uniref:Uncharacterized protein n=1 Tax=Marinobacterium halophilum TaxID=267374 RepID=A0A2P8EZR7_9GAMM|nr:hypothetical protein CLV44_106144 [Marinobacterium halophilum]